MYRSTEEARGFARHPGRLPHKHLAFLLNDHAFVDLFGWLFGCDEGRTNVAEHVESIILGQPCGLVNDEDGLL
jgi:hypothetical protein